MSTFGAMVDDTIAYLSGYTGYQDQATYLTSTVDFGATTLPVFDSSAMSRGLVEIEDELVWVDTVDTSNQVLKVPPYGRGFRSTTAVTHTVGTRVVAAPMFPRRQVAQALNDAIQAIYPNVSGIGSTTFTFNPAVSTYSLPTGSEDILQVKWQSPGPSKEWLPVRRWDIDSSAVASAFATGSSISIYDAIVPGRTVSVVYTKQPSVLVNKADDFATVTGLPQSCEDLVRLGAAYRLIPFIDSPHLAGLSAEADLSSNMRPVGGAGALGKQILQMYRLRLQEETSRQQALFPVRVHYTR